MQLLTMIEFPTRDAEASAAFFQQAFGLRYLSYGPDYTDVELGHGQSLGFQADAAEAPRCPLAVVQVEDLDRARQTIELAGGTITREPFDFPGGRRFHFQEPGGNELAAWTPAS